MATFGYLSAKLLQLRPILLFCSSAAKLTGWDWRDGPQPRDRTRILLSATYLEKAWVGAAAHLIDPFNWKSRLVRHTLACLDGGMTGVMRGGLTGEGATSEYGAIQRIKVCTSNQAFLLF